MSKQYSCLYETLLFNLKIIKLCRLLRMRSAIQEKVAKSNNKISAKLLEYVLRNNIVKEYLFILYSDVYLQSGMYDFPWSQQIEKIVNDW